MATTIGTVGQAIDATLTALQALDKKQQQIVLTTVCSLLELATSTSAPQPISRETAIADEPPARRSPPIPPGEAVASSARGATVHEPGVDIRAFKLEKRPSSAQQMACVAAYYLMELAPQSERKHEIKTADIDRLFKQAGFALPAKLEQLLPDSKAAGYFESVARGRYKLSRVGYNLVTHGLPKAKAAG
jgi:hypothetical protein